ncbi:MAG: hypothetical protein K6E55_10705 [Thermoguttaceae bacterium]|nr:hypothetical protein [Thermoguttaceae bacterium]
MPNEGLKLTIDVSDLNDKLKQSLKNIGATYDNFGRLTDQNKKFIGTLSMTQIRMGDYIDAQGKMRNAHNFCIDGLTRNQQALRMFRDELGNVYSAEGNLIEISKQRIAALDAVGKKAIEAEREKLAAKRNDFAADEEGTKEYLKHVENRIKGIEKEAAKRELAIKRNEALGKSLSAIGSTAGNLSQVAAIFGQMGGTAGKTAQVVSKLAQGIQLFVGTTNSIMQMQTAMKTLTVATKTQEAAQVGLNLASGNLVGIVGGVVAGVASLASMFLHSGAKEETEKAEKLVEKYDQLTVAMQKYGLELKNTNVYQAAALASSVTEYDQVRSQINAYDDLAKKVREAEDAKEARYNFMARTNNANILSRALEHDKTYQGLKEELDSVKASQEEAKSKLAGDIAGLFSKDMESDPLKELKERAAFMAEIIDRGALEGEALARAEAALANNLAKQAEIAAKEKGYGDFLKKEEAKIVQPKTQEELDAAIKKAAGDLGEGSETYKTVVENMRAVFEKEQKAREKADAEKRLADAEKALGDKFQAYADGSALWTAQEKAAHDLQATIDTWTQNFKDAGRSQAELDAAIVNLKQEYKDKQLQEYLNANDLKIKETEKLDAEAQYTETLRKIREAEETYGLQAAEAEKLRAQATEELADARMKKAEEERQQRESRLSELGITGLREQMKSPFEKMMEQQMKIQQAQAEGLISAAESNQLQAKLTADYWQQSAQQTESGERETGFEREEYKAASSLTAGSNELYQAMTQRESSTERYQTGVTKNLGNMARYSEENYETLQAIQANLASVMQTLGVV